jgi:hypothetical protein
MPLQDQIENGVGGTIGGAIGGPIGAGIGAKVAHWVGGIFGHENPDRHAQPENAGPLWDGWDDWMKECVPRESFINVNWADARGCDKASLLSWISGLNTSRENLARFATDSAYTGNLAKASETNYRNILKALVAGYYVREYGDAPDGHRIPSGGGASSSSSPSSPSSPSFASMGLLAGGLVLLLMLGKKRG